MRVRQIIIKDFMCFEHLDVNPGSITRVEGANGTGKTSFEETIKAILGGGHDATLLRKGADKGVAIIILDDDVKIIRTVTADRSKTEVVHPTFGTISQPAAYLKNLSDSLSVNPAKFLTLKPKERVDELISTMPMQLEASQLPFVPVEFLKKVDLSEHAMIAAESIKNMMYDARTGVNRSLKDKEATARQLNADIAPAPPAGDWKTQLAEYQAEMNALQNDAMTRLRKAKKATEDYIAAAEEGFNKSKDDIAATAAAAIRRIEARRDEDIEAARSLREQAISNARNSEAQERAEIESDYRPKEAALRESIGRADAMIKQEERAQGHRKLAAQMEAEAQKLREESDKLTNALAELEKLKSSLLSSLPIPGLEVRDGEIYVDGVPFDRVNESARVRLAIEIAKRRAGELGLVLVDGLECMDSKTFAEFEKAAAESGLQFIISRVSDTPLTISTKEVA